MLTLLLAGCLPKLPAVSIGAVEPLPLVRTSNDRRWFVPVDVNGEPWVWFVDTGYAVSTCDDGLTDALSVVPRGRAVVRGETGRLRAQRAVLPTFELGGHRIAGLDCVVRDLHQTSSIRDPDEVRVAGVLGMDVFQAFQLELDPGVGELRLHPPGTFDVQGVELRSAWFDPRMRIAVDVGDERLWPHVDTGTFALYLDGVKLGLDPIATREGVVVRGTGSGEHVRDIHQYRETLGFAADTVRDVLISGRPQGGGSQGLVGLSLLSRYVTVWDFRNRRASFSPVEAKPVPQWRTWRASGATLEHSHF